MACMEHDWFFLTACPTCAREATPPPGATAPPIEETPVAGVEESHVDAGAGVPAEVTAPVTEPPYVEPPLPDFYCCERVTLDIPLFLLRRADGGWKYPRFHVASAVPVGPSTDRPVFENSRAGKAQEPRDIREWSDAELIEATSSAMSTRDRQPILRELHRREDIKKARERIAKMKETMGEPRGDTKRSDVPSVRRVRAKRR